MIVRKQIPDPDITTPTAQRREGGGVLVRQGGGYVVFGAAELDQLLAFVRGETGAGGTVEFDPGWGTARRD